MVGKVGALVMCLGVGCATTKQPPPVPSSTGEGLLSYVDVDGPMRARVVRDDGAEMVIFYGSEQRGSMNECTCPSGAERGGLARVKSYLDVARQSAGDSLVVNAGYWLDNRVDLNERLRPDVGVANEYVLQGFSMVGWDVLNVAHPDLPWLARSGRFPAGAVSANLRPDEPEVLPTHRLLDFEGLRVAVTGVSSGGLHYMLPDDFQVQDPVEALEALIPVMRDESDLVVVLVYDLKRETRRVAALDGVDVIVEAGGFHTGHDPHLVDGTVWVRSDYETQALGELRLEVSDGAITGALDRKVDLDKAVPLDGRVKRLAKEAADAREAAR